MLCQPCRNRRHGEACDGCTCRCRGVLALDLFEFGDPTAPGPHDVPDPDEERVA